MITSERLNRMNLRVGNLAATSGPRALFCFCIDTSSSMRLSNSIDRVKEAVFLFLEKMRNTSTVADTLEVCMLTFADEVKLLCDYGTALDEEIEKCRTIQANGSRTLMGAAVEKALQRLDDRMQMIIAMHKKHYVPWLIIISDGDANDKETCERVAQDVRLRQRRGELKVKCLCLPAEEDDATETLQKFTIDNQIDHIDKLQLVEFAEMLSRAVTEASRQSVLGEIGNIRIDG